MQGTRALAPAETRQASGRLSDCAICEGRGFVSRKMENDLMYDFLCECKKVSTSLVMIARSGLQDAIERMTLDAFIATTPWQKRVKTAAENFVYKADGAWFFIGGQTGCGKTHICTAIVGELLKRGRPSLYMRWKDDSAMLKAMTGDSRAYLEKITPWKDIDVLYIDDFLKTPGADTPTKGDLNLAFEIINYRYSNPRLITVISSEGMLGEITDIDAAIGGRIKERAGRFVLNVEREDGRDKRVTA